METKDVARFLTHSASEMKMVKKRKSGTQKAKKINTTSLVVDNQEATSFGGATIIDRLASRLSIWKTLCEQMPEKRMGHDRIDIVKGAVAGFATGCRGTALLHDVAQDEALKRYFQIGSLPGEKSFWDELKRLGSKDALDGFHNVQTFLSQKVLRRIPVEQLQITHGFIPLFGDGTLLEGSDRREGTKFIKDKGTGLMWGTWFLGPMLTAQHLCGKGEGEVSAVMGSLSRVLKDVVDVLGRRREVLVMMDSLHGDNPTLSRLDDEKLHYIVGANKLAATTSRLHELPDNAWTPVAEKKKQKGRSDEEVCLAYIQCADWDEKRLIVCKRFKRDGELLWNHFAVFCNIPAKRLGYESKLDPEYMTEVWKLYSLKMGEENSYKNLLIDLLGHCPPCTAIERNRAYYALLALSYNLIRAVDLLAGTARRTAARQENRRTVRTRRIATIRRRIFALPALITIHARKATIRLIGGGSENLRLFEEYWHTIATC